MRFPTILTNITARILVILITTNICLSQSLNYFFYGSLIISESDYYQTRALNQEQAQITKGIHRVQEGSEKVLQCSQIITLIESQKKKDIKSYECIFNNNGEKNNNVLQILQANEVVQIKIKSMDNKVTFQSQFPIKKKQEDNLFVILIENYVLIYYYDSFQVEFLAFNFPNDKEIIKETIQQNDLGLLQRVYQIGNLNIRVMIIQKQKFQAYELTKDEDLNKQNELSRKHYLLIEEIQQNKLTIYQLETKQITIFYNSQISEFYKKQFVILSTNYQNYESKEFDYVNNKSQNQYFFLFSLVQMKYIAKLENNQNKKINNQQNDLNVLESLINDQVCIDNQTVYVNFSITDLLIVFDNVLQQIKLLEETANFYYDSINYELTQVIKIIQNQNKILVLKNNNEIDQIEIKEFKLLIKQQKHQIDIQDLKFFNFNHNRHFCLNLKQAQKQNNQYSPQHINQIIKSTSFIYQIIEKITSKDYSCSSFFRVINIIDRSNYYACNNCDIQSIQNTSTKDFNSNCTQIYKVQNSNQNTSQMQQTNQENISFSKKENRYLKKNEKYNEEDDIQSQNGQQIQKIDKVNFEVFSDFINSNILIIKLDQTSQKLFQEYKNKENNNFFQIKINQQMLNTTQITISEIEKGDIMINILIDNFILNPLLELQINPEYSDHQNTQIVSFSLPIITPPQSLSNKIIILLILFLIYLLFKKGLESSSLLISFFTKILYFLNFLAIFIGQFSGYLINVEILQYISLLSYSKSLQNGVSINMSKYLSFFNCNWSSQNYYQLISLNKSETVKVNIFGFPTKLHLSDEQYLLFKGYYSQSFLYSGKINQMGYIFKLYIIIKGYTSMILLGLVLAIFKIINFIRSKRNSERDEICFYRILRVIQIELESDVIGNIIQLTFIQLVFSAVSHINSFFQQNDFTSQLQIFFFLVLHMDRSIKSVWKTFFYNIRETDFSRRKLTAYPIMIAFRKIALVLTTVLFYNQPLTQIFLIFAINLICSLVSIFKLHGPFQETILNYYMSIQELILLIIVGTHISYAFCYDQLLNQQQNQISNNNKLVNQIETTIIIEFISVSAIIIINFLIVIKFIKKNISCFNKKQVINAEKNQHDPLMIGSNEKYYLLSQVDVKIENQKKQAKSHTLSDEESLNPQELVASKQQIKQQMQEGGIELNQNEINYYQEKSIFQQHKQSDAFTPRKLNYSNKSFINNMIELEASNNKIILDDNIPKTAKNLIHTNNIPNQQEEQKSQINFVDDETLIPPPQNYDIEDNSMTEVNQTLLNQNDMLIRMKQKLNVCNSSINYLQNLLNNYNLSTHNIQDQLNILNDKEEVDSANRNQANNNSCQCDQIQEDDNLQQFYVNKNQIQSSNLNKEFIQM